ncbi:hypothetical protein D3C72_925030 [compost metagenome]
MFSRFDDDRASCGERRADFPGQHQQREVPGQYAAHHADRLPDHHSQRVAANRGGIVINLVNQFCVPADRVDGVRDVDQLTLTDRFAAIEAFEDGQFVLMAFKQVCKLQQNRFALPRRNRSPASILKGLFGIAHRKVDILGRTGGDVSQKLTRRRIVRGEGFARDRGFKRAIDECLGGQRNVFGQSGILGLVQKITHGWLPKKCWLRYV